MKFNIWKAITGDSSIAESGRKIDDAVRSEFRHIDDVLHGWTNHWGDMLDKWIGLGYDFPKELDGELVNKASSAEYLPVVYGQKRIGGTIVFMEASGEKNRYLHIVLALCEGEIESIDEVWLDDVKSSDSRYTDYVTIPKDTEAWIATRTRYGWLGTTSQAPDSTLVSATSWTTSHQLKGVAYLYVKLDYNKDVFSGIPTILCDVRGKRVVDTRDTTTTIDVACSATDTLIRVAATTMFTQGQSAAVTLDDGNIHQSTISAMSTGNSITIVDGIPSDAGVGNLVEPAGYSTNPALCIRDYLRSKVYGKGLDIGSVDDTAISTAANTCDTRMDGRTSSPSGYLVNQSDHAATDNTVVVDTGSNDISAGDTFTVPSDTTQYLVIGVSGSSPDFTLTYLPSARTAFSNNDALDFQMDYFGCTGAIKTDRMVMDNVKLLMTSCRGLLPYIAGKYTLLIEQGLDGIAVTAGSFVVGSRYIIVSAGTTDFTLIGAADSSVGTVFTATGVGSGTGTASVIFGFTTDNILGGWSFKKGGKDVRLNRVNAQFANPSGNWRADIVVQDSTTYRTADSEVLLEKTIPLQLETNPYRALYIANTALKKSRQDISVSFIATIEALNCTAGDIVDVTHSTPGWANKLFRVVSLTLLASGNVACQLQEHEEAVYDRAAEAGVQFPSDTNLPDPFHTRIADGDVELRLSNWTRQTGADTEDLLSVAWGNGVFVAAGGSGVASGDHLATSPEGIRWTQQTIGTTKMASVIYSDTDSQFVCVGISGAIKTSTDGSTWTTRTSGSSANLWRVAYGNGYYIAVGESDGTNAEILRSSDGVTWSDIEPSVDYNLDLYGVAYGNGIWVAVGIADGTSGYLIISLDDGVTWTRQTTGLSAESLYGVTYGDGKFIVVGQADGTDAGVFSSTDAVSWTEISNPRSVWLYSVIYANGIFVACGGATGSDGYVLTSIDGETWTERRIPDALYLYDIAYSSDVDVFVAVGQTSSPSAYLLTSLYK